MKPKIYIHRNYYARGFGLSIVREGVFVFSFWFWHLSGYFYFGELMHIEESWQKRREDQLEERARVAEVRLEDIKKEIRELRKCRA